MVLPPLPPESTPLPQPESAPGALHGEGERASALQPVRPVALSVVDRICNLLVVATHVILHVHEVYPHRKNLVTLARPALFFENVPK